MDYTIDSRKTFVDLGMAISLLPADLAFLIDRATMIDVEFKQIAFGRDEGRGDIMGDEESRLCVRITDGDMPIAVQYSLLVQNMIGGDEVTQELI